MILQIQIMSQLYVCMVLYILRINLIIIADKMDKVL